MSEVQVGMDQADERTFSVSSRRLEHGLVVALSGEVDISSAPVAERELRRAEESHDRVVLDLSEVRFMDSTGLQMVLAGHRRLQERGGSLLVVPGQRQVRRLFELTQMDARLHLVEAPLDSVSDALAGSPEDDLGHHASG